MQQWLRQTSMPPHLHVHNAALLPSPTLPLQELGLDMPQGSQDEEGAAHQSLTQVGSPLWHSHLSYDVITPSCLVKHDTDLVYGRHAAHVIPVPRNLQLLPV